MLAFVFTSLVAACGGSKPGGVQSASDAVAGTGPSPNPVAASPQQQTQQQATPRWTEPVRDVVLVTIDTLRADATGFGGNARAETPVLDRLAAAGQVYDRAHAHNVVTLPSHANILTGRYPFEHGVRDNTGFVLGPALPTAATLFSAAGFATAAFVAAFPLDARYGLARGFDRYDDQLPARDDGVQFRSTERAGEQVVTRALAWWRAHGERRRFLWLHLFEPHAPYEPPEPFASRFADQPYLGEVATVDAELRPLLTPFLAGREAPALIVLTADHGEALGAHGETTHGLFAYEPTLHVPLVLWAPSLEPGHRHTPARHIDLLPTMLDAAAVAKPQGLSGRSLLAPPLPHTASYFEALSANLGRGWAPLRGVLQDGDKLIDLPQVELYHLDRDRDEADNRAPVERRRVAAMRALLAPESAWPPRRTSPIRDEQRAALRSLGYSGGQADAKRQYTVRDDPKNLVAVDQAVHRFIDRFQRGALEEATAIARQVVRDQPKMALGYENLAQVLLERGQTAEALAVMARAVREDAASPPLLRQKALTHLERGEADAALAVMLPRRTSEDPEDLATLGVVLAEAGRLPEAKAALEKSFDFDPSNPRAHENLALVALRMQNWPEAEQQARTAIAGSDRLHHAWNYLGVARLNLGRPRQAIEAWERAAALVPDDADSLFNIALVAARLGDRTRTKSALERFLEHADEAHYAADIVKARAMLKRLETAP